MKKLQIKFFELQKIAEFISKHKKIEQIYRIDYETLKINFDKRNNNSLYFNMSKSNSFIYHRKHKENRSQKINAPFDSVMIKRIERANLEKTEIINDDKILRLTFAMQNSYKLQRTILQFEFTGKHTNIIILDENLTVLEALRHISEFQSSRFVKIGEKLDNPPPPPYTKKPFTDLDNRDILDFLEEKFVIFQSLILEMKKNKKINDLNRKKKRLEVSLNKLDDKDLLIQNASDFHNKGVLISSFLHSIPKYDEKFTLTDFEGNLIEIERPKKARNNQDMINIFFNQSKKLKQKAENIEIEKTNLTEKIDFINIYIANIQNCETLDEVNLLTQENEKQNQNSRKKEKQKNRESDLFETFWIENFKILLGKNSKGNKYLLEKSKAKDIWLHLKDRPSTHVFIVTYKTNVPENVIFEASKLCVDFSVTEKGNYLVDYTQRRNVKLQANSMANVNYINYKTIQIDKT